MANHLAIATATEVLRRRLTAAISVEFPGVQVMAKRPEANDAQAQSHVSLFLYRISTNAALRNIDLPTRGPDGRPVLRPAAALDLHYLLSFSGDEQELVPQRMLGLAVASLHADPVLRRHEIEAACLGGWLAGSTLGDDVEQVKLTPASISLDELSKVWSVFFQIPYQLSIGYEASVVLIESDVEVREALPVRSREVEALPIRRPSVEAVNGGRPVVGEAGLELEITGQRLRGPVTLVQFDEAEPQPVIPRSDTRIIVPQDLTAALGAGVHSVRVIHQVALGAGRVPHRAAASNDFRFALRPSITLQHPSGDTAIKVRFSPPVQQGQRVRLTLNELLEPPPKDRALRSRVLDPGPPVSAAPWAELAFDASAIQAGTYLVRARVDDVESLTGGTAGVDAPAPLVRLP